MEISKLKNSDGKLRLKYRLKVILKHNAELKKIEKLTLCGNITGLIKELEICNAYSSGIFRHSKIGRITCDKLSSLESKIIKSIISFGDSVFDQVRSSNLLDDYYKMEIYQEWGTVEVIEELMKIYDTGKYSWEYFATLDRLGMIYNRGKIGDDEKQRIFKFIRKQTSVKLDKEKRESAMKVLEKIGDKKYVENIRKKEKERKESYKRENKEKIKEMRGYNCPYCGTYLTKAGNKKLSKLIENVYLMEPEMLNDVDVLCNKCKRRVTAKELLLHASIFIK